MNHNTLQQPTVLVVDDNVSICDAVTDILELAGIHTIVASNGLQGLHTYQANTNTINLVILDLMMPIMGGETALHKIRAYDPTARVLIASGSGDTDNMRRLLNLGAIGFLHKPYDLHALLNAVDKGLKHQYRMDVFRSVEPVLA